MISGLDRRPKNWYSTCPDLVARGEFWCLLTVEAPDASIDANAILNSHYTHIWCSKNLIFSDFSWFGVMLIKIWKLGSSDVRWGRHAKVYLEAPGTSIDANCVFALFHTSQLNFFIRFSLAGSHSKYVQIGVSTNVIIHVVPLWWWNNHVHLEENRRLSWIFKTWLWHE